MPGVTELYDRDFYAWTQHQAAALRAWPEAMRPNTLDIAHIAEAIEDLGSAQRTAAGSLIRQILIHLLKLRLHPDEQPGLHWRKEIREFRAQLEDILAASPSLRARRAEIAEAAWARAARQVRRDLEDEGHADTARAAAAFTAETPYFDLDREVLAEDWFPGRG